MRDPKIEALLSSNPNIVWDYNPAIGLHSINEQKSFVNQARVSAEVVDRELVRQYQMAIRNGDQFPAIVVYEEKDGSYVNIDGNHRYAAFRGEKVPTIDAYVVLADNPLERMMLTFELNTLNGRPTGDETRALQAVTLVSQGFTRLDIANRLHVSTKFIEDAMMDYQGLERAKRLGVAAAWNKIETKGTRTKIQSFLPLDKVFAATVLYMSKYPPKVSEVSGLLNQVKSFGSELEQLQFVKNLESQAKANADAEKKASQGKRRGGKGAPITTIMDAWLSALISTKADYVAYAAHATEEERENKIKKLNSVITRLQDAITLLQNS